MSLWKTFTGMFQAKISASAIFPNGPLIPVWLMTVRLNILDKYSQQLYLDPDLDGEFENLALRRMSHNPFRYYVWLPLLRMADMWLRPRTEMLPVDGRWWEFSKHRGQSVFALIWAGINLGFLLLAWRGWSHGTLGPLDLRLSASYCCARCS